MFVTFQNTGRSCDYESLKEKLNCSQQTIASHRPSGSSLLNINGLFMTLFHTVHHFNLRFFYARQAYIL